MNGRQLRGNKIRALQRGALKVYTGKINAPENCIIKQCPRQVKPPQEPACEYKTSQIRYDLWMLLSPLVPEVWGPSPQRFLEDL
jgi:hypothetical protein